MTRTSMVAIVTDYSGDASSQIKAEYLAAGNQRDNPFWGWIHKERG